VGSVIRSRHMPGVGGGRRISAGYVGYIGIGEGNLMYVAVCSAHKGQVQIVLCAGLWVGGRFS
jgi:hypothetical protein